MNKKKKNPQPDKSCRKDKSKIQDQMILGLVFMAVVMMVFVILSEFGGCSALREELDLPVYEDGTPGYEPDADINATETRLNLPVMPDCIITADKPDVLIPYPEQNLYDIELSFMEKGSKEELYRTNRIRPGTVVSVPAYDFIKKNGEKPYRIKVTAYDHATYREVESDVELEVKIKKK